MWDKNEELDYLEPNTSTRLRRRIQHLLDHKRDAIASLEAQVSRLEDDIDELEQLSGDLFSARGKVGAIETHKRLLEKNPDDSARRAYIEVNEQDLSEVRERIEASWLWPVLDWQNCRRKSWPMARGRSLMKKHYFLVDVAVTVEVSCVVEGEVDEHGVFHATDVRPGPVPYVELDEGTVMGQIEYNFRTDGTIPEPDFIDDDAQDGEEIRPLTAVSHDLCGLHVTFQAGKVGGSNEEVDD